MPNNALNLASLVSLQVALGARSYPIFIGEKLLLKAGQLLLPHVKSKRVIIVSDKNVAQRYLHRLSNALAAADIRYASVVLPAGEQTKSFTQFEKLLEELLSHAPDRNTTLIALGGGVIGDITGFAASVLLRGVPFIQIPTSLLAQVDSSVGGKTAINAATGKNLVGTFYQPKAVLIDTETLGTLPPREWRAGYAEVLKYGAIKDAKFFGWLETLPAAPAHADVARMIETSCACKAAIVAVDETEQDMRALLNFGHTFGHALEAETGFSDTLLHGEAVAIGMVMAARLSAELGLCAKDVETRLTAQLKKVGLPARPRDIQENWNVDALMQHFTHDKKAEDGTLTFVLLKALGEAVVMKQVDKAVVKRCVEEGVRA